MKYLLLSILLTGCTSQRSAIIETRYEITGQRSITNWTRIGTTGDGEVIENGQVVVVRHLKRVQ